MDVWYSGDYGISFYEYGGELYPIGKFLGHTWKNWSLIPTARPFAKPPTIKTSELDLHAIHGKIDTTTSLTGFPLYNNREGSWTFYVADNNDYSEYIEDHNSEESDLTIDRYVRDHTAASPVNMTPPMWDVLISGKVQTFQEKYSQLLSILHGRTVALVLDEDPTHFYRGRIEVEDFVASNDGSLNGITIKYDLYPFKMDINETIIDLILGGAVTYITSGQMPIIPYFKADASYTRMSFYNDETTFSMLNKRPPVSSNVWGKLIADYQADFPSIILTNVSGTNTCRVQMNQYSSSYPLTTAQLKYRNGWL